VGIKQQQTALFLFPNLVRKTSSNPPINFAPSPSSRFKSPFLRNTLAEWGTGEMGDFPLKHPAEFYFFSVFGEHIRP
jgi:hypothetical protein